MGCDLIDNIFVFFANLVVAIVFLYAVASIFAKKKWFYICDGYTRVRPSAPLVIRFLGSIYPGSLFGLAICFMYFLIRKFGG